MKTKGGMNEHTSAQLSRPRKQGREEIGRLWGRTPTVRQHAGGSSVRNSGGSGLGFGGALGERGKHETEMGREREEGDE